MSGFKSERMDGLDYDHIYKRYCILSQPPYNLNQKRIAERLSIGQGSLSYIVKLKKNENQSKA